MQNINVIKSNKTAYIYMRHPGKIVAIILINSCFFLLRSFLRERSIATFWGIIDGDGNFTYTRASLKN